MLAAVPRADPLRPAVQGWLAAATGYHVLLLVAAAARRVPPPVAGEPALRLLVLVPAHDEEAGLGACLASLRALDYPVERWSLLVLADNCTDGTAAVAAAAGADVLERTDPARPGKGAALAWALERLAGRADWDALVVVDADCAASPNLLRALEARLRAGAPAVQADDVVANPEASAAAGLRYAAFRLINTVRPRGREALGLSCGLFGTGMALRRDLLARLPWQAGGLAEDAEYHLRLVAAGERAAFAPEAAVTSAMPARLAGSGAQQARWEGGRVTTAVRWAPRLAAAGLRARDPRRLASAAELLVPPQALLAAGNVAALLATRRRAAALTLAAHAFAVVGGLALVRAPWAAWRGLVLAPALVASKLVLYLRLLAGRGPREWRRTERA